MDQSRFRPSPALVISLIALFVSIGGVGYAASKIGTNDLKNGAVTSKKLHRNAVKRPKIKGNAVNGAKVEDDSLTGDDIQESTLGQVPSAKTADSATSADDAQTLDGMKSGDFQAKSDVVSIHAPSISFGNFQYWDIGPYIRLSANCSTSAGTNHLTVRLLNNAPGSGQWFLGDMIYPGDKPQVNPATAWTRGGVIQSGNTDMISESVYPPANTSSSTSSHAATLTWWDGSGETITVNYTAIAYAHYCAMVGTAIRATA